MMYIETDGTLTWTNAHINTAGRTKETFELPIELLNQHDDLIDRVFAFAFDVLSIQTVELRVQPSASPSRKRRGAL